MKTVSKVKQHNDLEFLFGKPPQVISQGTQKDIESVLGFELSGTKKDIEAKPSGTPKAKKEGKTPKKIVSSKTAREIELLKEKKNVEPKKYAKPLFAPQKPVSSGVARDIKFLKEAKTELVSPNIEGDIEFLTGRKTKPVSSGIASSVKFLKEEGTLVNPKIQADINFLLGPKMLQPKMKQPETTAEVIKRSQQILFDGSLTDEQKVQTWTEYLTKSLGQGASYAAEWLWSSAKMFTLLAAFYSLGSVAAAAAAAGSGAHFLGILSSLGYGGIVLSGPLLTMLTKGLGASLIKGVGTKLTIDGLLKLAKTAGATKFLETKLDDGYVKSFFVKIGIDPKAVNNEVVVKELANVFLTVAPAAVGMAGFLPTGLMFLAGDPVSTLALNYGLRAGTTAVSKTAASLRPNISLRKAVSSVVESTRKVKEAVVSELLSSEPVHEPTLVEQAEIMVETKEKLDEIVKDTLPVSQIIQAEQTLQKDVIESGSVEGSTIEVPETLQENESENRAIGIGKSLGIGAVALAFASGAVDFGAIAQMGGGALATVAETTMSGTVSLAQSETAQAFLLNALGGKAVSKLYRKIWGDTDAIRQKETKELYQNYKKAVAEKRLAEAKSLASSFWLTITGSGLSYTPAQLEKLKLAQLQSLARTIGIKPVGNESQLRAAIVIEQIRKLNAINDAVSGTITSVAVLAASHMTVQGIQSFQSGELQNLLNDPNIKAGPPPVKLEFEPTVKGETFTMKEGITQRLETPALKDAQRQARAIETAKIELQKQIEADLAKQRFEQALAARLAQGKTIGGTTILESGQPITGYDFSTSELLAQIDKEFGNTQFTTLLDMFAGTAGWKAANSLLDFVPGMGTLRMAATGLGTAQYAQASVDILEKVGQLASGGLGKVAEKGFEQTYASTFEGIQKLTKENAAEFAANNLGKAGEAFRDAISGSTFAKTNAAQAIKSIVVDMLKNGEEVTQRNLYTRIGAMLVGGDVTQQGTLAAMGKNLYDAVMGGWK